jgi:hypothetical protein
MQNPLLHRHSPIQPRPTHTYTTVQTPVTTPQTAIRWPSTLLNPHQVPGWVPGATPGRQGRRASPRTTGREVSPSSQGARQLHMGFRSIRRVANMQGA